MYIFILLVNKQDKISFVKFFQGPEAIGEWRGHREQKVWKLKARTGQKQCVAVPSTATRVTWYLKDHLVQALCFKDQEK